MSRRVREALRRGRRDLHREMSVPALYISVPNATPLPCTVRPQDLPGANGKPGGGDQGYAQVADLKPKIIFCTDDAPGHIRVNAVVSVEPGEAYRIAFVHPQHGITITADVVRLNAAESAGLPVPADSAAPGPFPHSSFDYVVPAYVHRQVQPASTWTVEHNLGRHPIVEVIVNGDVVDAPVHHVSDQVLQVSLGEPVAGEARCV